MSSKLDLKDRKLLALLAQDARLSHTQLAKRIGLSKNAIPYRIDRLRQRGIVTKFTALLNPGAMHHTTFLLLLRLNEDIVTENSIPQLFVDHPFTDWVAVLSGDWDIAAEFVCRDLDHMRDLVRTIEAELGARLHSYRTFFSFDILKVEHLPRDFIEREEPPSPARIPRTHELDATDARVLEVLSEDSSLPYVELARRAETTVDIARYRIARLMEAGVILRFAAEIALPKLGYTEYLCTVELASVDPKEHASLLSDLRSHGAITYAFQDTLAQRIVFTCAFTDPMGIDALMRDQRKRYACIASQTYLIITQQLKFDLFPKGLLDSIEQKDI